MWFGWAVALIGLGVLSTIQFDTSQAKVIGFTVLVGIGIGYVDYNYSHKYRKSLV